MSDQWKGFRLTSHEMVEWKSSDGTPVEGMLIYPPGKCEAKGLPMLTLIHGGPADADGDHFEADWYQWSALAATNGWLVFQPNYRGSTGYGDKFLMQIVPEIVSRPGNDILAGVDALVAVYHSDHRELCAHERDWPFRIINVLEVVGESMGLHRDDRYKQLKLMQDADQIVAECRDLIAQHSLDAAVARSVVAKGMLGDQPLPLKSAL